MKTKPFPQPKIIEREAIHIIGLRTQMSLAQNTTVQLWRSFGPRQKEIVGRIDKGSYSIQRYDADFATKPFLPTTVFEKWAGVAVSDTSAIPNGLESLEIPAGKWVVFLYKGIPQDFGKLVSYVMTQWLPSSGYTLDDRPQFEYMDEHYAGPMNPESQEEFWVPIVMK